MSRPDRPPIEAAGTTEDVFLGNRLIVRQPAKGYRAGIDAVLLAACVRQRDGSVLDIGSGVGTVGLCVASRCSDSRVVLIEREANLAALARVNIAANAFGDRVTVVEADLNVALSQIASAALPAETFAHVLANPPYHDHGAGTASDHVLKATSHAMPAAALDGWARFMARMTRPGGCATMIHKAEALPRILQAYDGRFGGIVVLPIHPRDGAPAIRVLVQGIKGSRAAMSIKPGLILHGDGNAFTPNIDAILRQGAAVEL